MSEKVDEGYHGVAPDVLTALGKMAVVAGMLEDQVDDVALALGQDVARDTLKPSIKKIRQVLAKHGPPFYATCSADAVLQWCERVLSVMDRRDRVLHGRFHLRRVEGEDWSPMHLHLKSRTRDVVGVDTLNEIGELLYNVGLAGKGLEVQLLPEIRPGLSFRYYHRLGDSQCVRRMIDGVWPEGPTFDEVCVWYGEVFLPSLPSGRDA